MGQPGGKTVCPYSRALCEAGRVDGGTTIVLCREPCDVVRPVSGRYF